MLELLEGLWRDEEGLSTVEYALLLVLIVIVGVTSWRTLGTSVSSKVTPASNAFGP